ncbi:MAG: ADP-glyceromanno-heptose 6-epimerase [Alphaproteobacteria bacterium]|nr:ADP-glyceromanno-heptose 6-epimerase [Alphaproteobacteria bacterium]
MIVVTGGAGFIGSNLVAALETRGRDDVAICDRLGTGAKWKNIAKRGPADIVAPERLFDFLGAYGREVEAIVHLGAISTTTETDVDLILSENFRLSMALWSWCARQGKRLIYASSAATYGDGSAGFDDDASAQALAKLRPLNPYGWSKHIFDRRVTALQGTDAPRPRQFVGLKFFNVYGPNEYHKGAQRSVAHQLWERARAGEPARLFRSHNPAFADGAQLRDFIWVDDCVDVMLWFLDNPERSGLYNVGTGKARSFLDLARATYMAAGRNAAVEFVDVPAALRAQYQYFTEARMERLRAAGYARPFTSLEDGVTQYVRILDSSDPYR